MFRLPVMCVCVRVCVLGLQCTQGGKVSGTLGVCDQGVFRYREEKDFPVRKNGNAKF